MTSKAMKISTLSAVGALVLWSIPFGSSAFATDTPTPTPTPTVITIPNPVVSPTPGQNSEDSNDNATEDINNSDEQAVGAEVQAVLGDGENDSADVQENDNEVDSVNAENGNEDASFNEDIAAANQSGDSEDTAALTAAAEVVTTVTVPEVKAMTGDNAEAHALIIGVPAK